ncbi:Synechocystis YCF37-like protein [Perilla frutescens var. hirtella]|uniref:Synechocystis YCF37-like protein n=1 Tax=Perilla frutescens var. hirtella TaxID=608512 RepID=A0AAD4JEF2_PERFH|nr:Synechocystis YCF37-like protein [Perilla frutescens var. hirtella]
MASTISLIAAQIPPPHSTHQKPHATKRDSAAPPLPTRRQCLLLLTATATAAAEMPARAQDIPLFGLRRSLRKAEEEAEVIVKEGFEAAEKGVVAAEKGIEAAEKGVEAAEKEIETVLSFGGLAQAGVVAGAEVLGVLIASSIVNAILGPEPQKS